MTDIEVLECEMECVRRKAQINCTNCGSCDLLVDDNSILDAYSRAIVVLRARQEVEKNEPLTLEELRRMDGEPVYIVPLKWYGKKEWAIVDRDSCQCLSPANHYFFENYWTRWLAYRRPPKEAQYDE